MKQFHWLLCVAKNCDWSRKIAPLSNLTRASLLVELFQRKQNWTAKSTYPEENAGKIKSVFVIKTALWVEELGRCLENYRSWKNTLWKLVVTVNLEAIWFEFWMKGAQMTEEIFVLCGWWFSNQLDTMSETHFSCDTVDRGLWLATLSSLLCPETDRNIRVGKQGSVYFILLILRRDVLMFHSWHQSACQQLFWHWERLVFLNKLISETFCLLGLLNSR